MFTTWIGYCLLISGLFGLAAFAADRALSHYRWPVRWVWVTAIAGSLVVPVVAFFMPGLIAGPSVPAAVLMADAPASTPSLVVPSVSPTPPIASGIDPAVAAMLSTLLGWGWGLAMAFMGFHLARTYRRLRAEMKHWTPGQVLDSPVLMSSDRGPAVVGVRRAVIVMPKWIAELDDELVRLVFLHEQEHRKAGDHRLFAVGIAALVLMPWNLFLWWQVTRLRLAIEFDCDRRVLANGVEPRRYAEALITVGSRVSEPLLAAAAFAERKPAVERRLRRMTEPLSKLRGPKTLGAAGVAALALILVFGAPPPAGFEVESKGFTVTTLVPAVDESEPAPTVRPSFIPYDTPPILTNGSEVQKAIQDEYPDDMKINGLGHRVEVWLYVEEDGSVGQQITKTSSGTESLDAAAEKVAQLMEFEPAKNRNQPIPVWVSQWFTFQPPNAEELTPPTPRFVLNGVLQPAGWTPAGIQGVLRSTTLAGTEAVEKYGEAGRHGVTEITQGEGGDGEIISIPPSSPRLLVSGRRLRSGIRPSSPTEVAGVDPLIVIDGVIQSDDVGMSDLRALDIDHIEITKGEAAIERFGERGKNGVIEITTKKAAARAPNGFYLHDVDGDGDMDLFLGQSVIDGDVYRVSEPGFPARWEDPLIVIDGVIQSDAALAEDGLAGLIDPAGIDHIEYVKPGVAENLYGSRASEGVLQITTKKSPQR